MSKVKVNTDEFINRYSHGALIPISLFKKLLCTDEIIIDSSVIDSLERKKEKYEENERLLYRCSELNNMGINYEKEGDTESAIRVYEENISGKCYMACHSFDRLMIIYRRNNDFKNEQRVIKRAISVLCKKNQYLKEKYELRLSKSIKLQRK